MYQKLRERGWSENELAHLKQNFWIKEEHSLFAVAGLVLMAIAAIFVPFAYGVIGRILTEGVFWVSLIFLGIPLGSMFGLLLIDLDRLEKHHHVNIIWMATLVILVSVWAALNYLNATAPAGAFTHNALIGAIVYAVSFIVPYAALTVKEWNYRIGSSNT